MKCLVYIWGGGLTFTDQKLRWLTEFCTRPGNVSMVQLNISLCFIYKKPVSPCSPGCSFSVFQVLSLQVYSPTSCSLT